MKSKQSFAFIRLPQKQQKRLLNSLQRHRFFLNHTCELIFNLSRLNNRPSINQFQSSQTRLIANLLAYFIDLIQVVLGKFLRLFGGYWIF